MGDRFNNFYGRVRDRAILHPMKSHLTTWLAPGFIRKTTIHLEINSAQRDPGLSHLSIMGDRRQKANSPTPLQRAIRRIAADELVCGINDQHTQTNINHISRKHTQTHTQTHKHTQTHTHTPIHAHTHKHAYTNTHTQAHTHKYTKTQSKVSHSSH